eukprot:2886424-Pleurochrysis_carterae.AAC.1
MVRDSSSTTIAVPHGNVTSSPPSSVILRRRGEATMNCDRSREGRKGKGGHEDMGRAAALTSTLITKESARAPASPSFCMPNCLSFSPPT